MYFIRSNTFTSSGNTLLAPYNNVHKFAAIVLDDVERVVIGDSSLNSSVSENEFSNSNCGIRAFNSSFELYNNHFSNITELDGEILEVDSKGACVSSISRSDFNDRYCIIGNKAYNLSSPSQSHRNKFHSSVFGIISRGEMNMKVYNNEFGNSASASDALTYCGIATYNSANKKIYISRGNAFYDYNVGVKAFSIGTAGTYHIVDNGFVNATSSIPANPTSFQGTAIWAANPMRPASIPNESYLQIINNRIGEPNNSQGRIGIFTSSIPVPQIQENKIYFQVSGVPASPTLGIWVQNSYDPKVVNNEIINTSNQTHGPSFTGIRSDMNTMGCFSLNKIQKMGYSFHFMGNHGQIGFAENEMNYYDHAIFLNNADIGVQGSPIVNAIRTDDNEFIHNSLGLQPDRVIGNTSSGSGISWYYDDSNGQLYNPDIYDNISSSTLDEVGVAPTPGLSPLQCPEVTIPIARNLAFGYIVRDSARYDESYTTQFNYHSKQKLYEIIKHNPGIIDMNDSTDVYYESFYSESLESNLAKFDSVRIYIESGDYPAALFCANNITDTNSIEEVCKYVYGIGINKLPLDSALSNTDSTSFYDIGLLHALTTGDAAFITRNNLFYEVHDDILGSGSRITQISNLRQTAFFVEVYPVPANDNIYFIYKNRMPESIEVFDIQQRCVLKSGSVNEINLNLLSPGSYFISFLENKHVLATKKIIKLQ